MPRYEVTAPDGSKFEVTAPEGASEDAVMAYARAQFARKPAQAPDPTEGNSFLQNAAIGAGKAVADAWRGAKQALGVGDQQALQTEIDESRRRDAPLMRTGGGLTGNVAAMALPAFVPGAQSVVGAGIAGALTGALQPTAGDESRLTNAALGGGLGAGGQYGGSRLAQMLTNRQGTATATAAANQSAQGARDAVLGSSQAAGYVVPPTQANPSLTNRIMEGFAGKLTTAQQASAKNQGVTNRMAAQALGLPPDQPITPDVLKGIRAQAGQAYEAVKQTGTVIADKPFTDALDRLSATYTGAAKAFPGLARNDVADLMQTLKVPQFGADAAVDAVRVLRETADTAFSAGNKALGKAAKGASDALENLLQRHVSTVGAPGLVDDFKNARQLIAKTYTVERALNPTTGTVNAGKLAADIAKGKPISGELRTAGEFAGAFPKAAQPVERMGSLPGSSPLDWALGGTMGAVTANPLALASVAARPSIRSMLLSGPYQSLMTTPTYSTSRTLSLAEIAARGGRAPAAGRALPAAYFAND